MTLKLLQLINTLAATDGGPARNSFELNQALNSRSDTVAQLWAVRGGPDKATPTLDKESGRTLLGPAPMFDQSLVRICQSVREFDVVVIHGVYLPWVPFVLASARMHGKPVILMPHGAISKYEMRKARAKKKLFDWVMKAAGIARVRFAVGSASEVEDVLTIRPTAEVRLVGVGTTIPSLPTRTAPENEDSANRPLRLLSLSRIAPKKRIDLMINAVAVLTARNVDVSLTIAGDGNEALIRQLKSQADDLGIRAKLEFVGHLDSSSKRDAFLASDIFLLPSEDENFGIGLAEALSHGLPSIVSDRVAAAVGISEDAVRTLHEPTGESLAEAVMQWADPHVWRHASDCASSEAQRAFDWTVVAERWLALANECMHAEQDSAPAIAYVSTSYPSFSETFVSSEMEAMRQRGWQVLSYSVRQPPADLRATVPYLVRPIGRIRLLPWCALGILRNSVRGRTAPRLRASQGHRSLAKNIYLDAHAARLAHHIRRSTHRFVGVHAHFLSETAEIAVRGSTGIPVMVTVHAADSYVEPTQENLEFLSRIDALRFASEAVLRTLSQTTQPDHYRVIPCIADLPAKKEYVAPQEGKVRIITIARLVSTKGFDQMMRVVTEASSIGPVKWTIVGDGPMRPAIEAWATGFDKSRLDVTLLGSLPHDQALTTLDDADVFLLLPEYAGVDLTRGDGLPVALMEAMAKGVPIVTSAAGGIPELVEDAVTGTVVNGWQDAEAVCAIWSANRTEDSLRRVRAGQIFVTQKFGPKATADELTKWLEMSFNVPKIDLQGLEHG